MGTFYILSLSNSKEKNILYIIFFLVSPTLIFLIIPYISLDQPWFLRRYVFTIIPFSFLIFSYLIFNIKIKKHIKILVISIILIINIFVASPIIILSENKWVINEVSEISNLFSNQDKILVDKYVLGNYKISEPLFFIFNKDTKTIDYQDINEILISRDIKSNTYIITNEDSTINNLLINSNINLSNIYEKDIKYKELNKTIDLFHLYPTVNDVHNLNYEEVLQIIKIPDNIENKEYKILVYRIN